MEGRKAALLEAIITEHIKTAEPVGSKFLAGRHGLSVSPATLRNDMAALEKEGYLTHPHTSAGRVPTVKGYRHFVKNCLAEKPLAKKDLATIEGRCATARNDERRRIKELAKAVAEIAHEAILVRFASDDVYYTGLSYLLAQPEFAQQKIAISFSRVLDHLDESMDRLIDVVVKEYTVAIGDESPFGIDTAIIVVRYGSEDDQVFGILGPTRMDYGENIMLAKYARTLIEKVENRK